MYLLWNVVTMNCSNYEFSPYEKSHYELRLWKKSLWNDHYEKNQYEMNAMKKVTMKQGFPLKSSFFFAYFRRDYLIKRNTIWHKKIFEIVTWDEKLCLVYFSQGWF